MSPIARTWQFGHHNLMLLRYLFHFECCELANPWDADEVFSLKKSSRPDPNDSVVLNLLQTKLESFSQAWRALSEDKTQQVTVDIVQILCSFCIATTLFAECLPQQSGHPLRELQQSSQRLWSEICSFLAAREDDTSLALLELISPILASAKCFFDPDCAISRCLGALAPPLAELLENIRHSQIESLSHGTENDMDLDDPILTPSERFDVHGTIINLNREALPWFPDAATFRRCLTIQLSIFHKSHTNTPGTTFDTALAEYLTSLDEPDLLSAQTFLPHVYHACSSMNRDSLLDILEDIGEKCLQSYGLERCESSQCLCIRMMDSFAPLWTIEGSDHFSESASDIYTWLTDVLLANRMASTQVYISLARLLDHVLRSNANYPGDQSSPSPRTCLFTILRQGDLAVKFSVANLISPLFSRFILQDHDAIFNDVLESLPRDPDWTEGIALRLFVLAQLAGQWHTLLRKSIYHMFETPAQVPHSVRYAEKCLQHVAKTLDLKDPREIFRLFSSQILYTWTESQSVKSMPFRMFGYGSLRDMLNDVQDEIVGQIIMRGGEHEAGELADCVKKPFPRLLATSFYKAEAYSIARDISTPPSQDNQSRGGENRLKKMLGTDGFADLVEKQTPQIIAAFFGSLDQYDQVERAFAKRANFQDALEVMRTITEKGASSLTLPANQQPSFRARFLLDELEFLCKRTGYDLSTIWTPTLVSFVCRTLFESIHPALGSLHACSVIRKIRILACLAGPAMLRDYPLEMALHGLRPFLTDTYCSEDTVGTFWYLLEAGAPYLTDNPAFMVGIAVSTFVSLRNFMIPSSDIATQDSQLRAAVPNAQRFLQWFEGFLDDYKSPSLSAEAETSFTRLARSARKLLAAENSSKEATERDLLLEVLRDQQSTHGLLNKSISDHVISLLCSGFQTPTGDSQSDLVGTDDKIVAQPTAIFQTIERFNPGPEYKLWAAKITGRAFAATGSISDVLLREQDPSLFHIHPLESPSAIFCASKANILQALYSMLQNDNHVEVGLVERTLQCIVSNLADAPEFEYCKTVIPSSLLDALTWSPYHCPAIGLPAAEAEGIHDAVQWDASLPSHDWARKVALFLAASAFDDPVIGALIKILEAIPRLAERLLPNILHDALLADIEGRESPRQSISDVFRQVLREVDENTISHARLVINCVLYLRNQPRPDEATIVERDDWLDIDYAEASSAANICRLPKTALLFLEISASRTTSGSRRSSVAKYSPPPDMLHDVFKNIDDPDLFYGIQRELSLSSAMERLEYESSGFKNLLFQSAQYDSEIQMSKDANMHGVVKALNATNLQGIANSMFSASGESKNTSGSFDSMLQTATGLRQWDIPVSPLNTSPTATVFRAFQSLNTSGNLLEVSSSIDDCILSTLKAVGSSDRSATSLRAAMRVLGIMTDISDVIHTTSMEDVSQAWHRMMASDAWLKTAR